MREIEIGAIIEEDRILWKMRTEGEIHDIEIGIRLIMIEIDRSIVEVEMIAIIILEGPIRDHLIAEMMTSGVRKKWNRK